MAKKWHQAGWALPRCWGRGTGQGILSSQKERSPPLPLTWNIWPVSCWQETWRMSPAKLGFSGCGARRDPARQPEAACWLVAELFQYRAGFRFRLCFRWRCLTLQEHLLCFASLCAKDSVLLTGMSLRFLAFPRSPQCHPAPLSERRSWLHRHQWVVEAQLLACHMLPPPAYRGYIPQHPPIPMLTS